MITEKDLQEAIAECQGQRNPNANTCIKLAAYYTIQREMFGDSKSERLDPTPVYSGAIYTNQPSKPIQLESDSEFAQTINNANVKHVWQVMDELMGVLRIINPKLYKGVLIKLEEG